mmetsp:Transcript_21116/g.29833  ORF Transcript_21116/g.29833 Transcript_21116/m.29833 type:complete len:380 (+) Transcript_21116:56-1195(+)
MVVAMGDCWARPTLYNLTSELIWPDVIARARTHPEEVIWRDNNGATPLHHSCRYQAVDALVVKEMLKSQQNAACIQDNLGSTPLHVACWNGSAEPIRLLIDANRNAASTRDKKGRTPLHVACSSFIPPSVDTIEILLKANPEAITTLDEMGQTPLALLCERHEGRLKVAIDSVDAGLKGDDLFSGVLSCFWQKLCILVQANVNRGFAQGKEWKLLHALTATPNCPRLLFQFAIKLYPEQIREPLNGSFPLHLAAQCPTSWQDEIYKDGYHICTLLSLFPQACEIPDAEGRLPIHLAVESGKSWEGVVQKLLALYPSAIMIQDGKESLYPFMIAALPKEDQGNLRQTREAASNKASMSCQDLTSTFELLTADPSLASCSH